MLIALVLAASLVPEAGKLPVKPPAPPTSILRRTFKDPPQEQLVIARKIATRLVPARSYLQNMDRSISGAEASLASQFREVAIVDLADQLGLALPAEQPGEEPLIRRRLLEIVDPWAARRAEIARPLIREVVRNFLKLVEPAVRESYAAVLAGHFTVAQLQEYERYMATENGRAFAEAMLNLRAHPLVFVANVRSEQFIADAFPKLVQQVKAATAALPPPKDVSSLSDGERGEIAGLLGVTPTRIRVADPS